MISEEIIYQKVYVSPRPPLKISHKDNWMCDLDSDVAGSSKDTQRIQPNPTPNYQVRGDPYVDKSPQSVACWHLNMLKKIKQVWGDPYWWIKKRSTKLISEYQDRHMQLWKKQNISEFKSLWKRSKIVLIGKHFMPTCSGIASTTDSAKNRRRWSANWVMWSYSSCAKLYQKYNVLTVFFFGIKELCTALADNAWLTANPEETKTGCTLSRTTW